MSERFTVGYPGRHIDLTITDDGHFLLHDADTNNTIALKESEMTQLLYWVKDYQKRTENTFFGAKVTE